MGHCSSRGWVGRSKMILSDQYNDSLGVCNIKTKKSSLGQKRHISENLQVTACSVQRFELYFSKMLKLDGKESLDPKMSDFE